MGLAKANSGRERLNSVVTQDLITGDGGKLAVGDSAEVKYSGWLMSDNTFGQLFDSNATSDKPFRLKIGRGKVIKV